MGTESRDYNRDSDRSITASAFSGAQYLIGLQLFVKLVTFIMNIVIVYLAGRDAFGVASVKFELVLSTILFLSREGIRSALLRVETPNDKDSPTSKVAKDKHTNRPSSADQQIINASLIPIFTGTVIASCIYVYMCIVGNTEPREYDSGFDEADYHRATAIYILAACVELCVEPLFVLSRARVLFKLQARCEGIAVGGRCVSIVLVLLVGRYASEAPNNNHFRLVAFAIGQMTYAVLILLTFFWFMSAELCYPAWNCYVPRPIYTDATRSGKTYINPATRRLAIAFLGQLVLKHFLTQGDSMVLSKYADDKTMGVFALVSKYGSAPASIIFYPLEEASRAVFSRLSSNSSSSSNESSNSDAPSPAQLADAHSASHVLTTLGKIQLLFGMLVAVFGTLYLPALLSVIRMNDASMVSAARAYCLYIPLMGLNGFLEAFVHSVASNAQLFSLNLWMVGISIVYATLSIYMLHGLGLGSTGVVAANMVSMGLRIVYSWSFILRWFSHLRYKSKPSVSKMLPSPAVAGSCILSGTAALVIIRLLGPGTSFFLQAVSLLVGCLLGTSVLVSIFYFETPFLRAVQDIRLGRATHHNSKQD